MADLYETLGVPGDADTAEIKAAYRKAVRKVHPDAGGKREDFDRVQLAYNILTDQRARDRYDRTGDDRPIDPVALQRQQAMTTVAGKLNMLISAPEVDPRHFDLVLGIKELIEAEATDIRKQIAESKRMQERLRQFEKRLKHKAKDAPDAVRPMIQAQIDSHQGRISALEDGLGVLTAAKELAAEYVYEMDRQEPVHMTRIAPMGRGTGWYSSGA